MEDTLGIPGPVPPLADYPAETVRSTLPPAEWQACLDSWLFSLELRLRIKDEHFSKFMSSQPSSGIQFLTTYCQNHSVDNNVPSDPKEAQLHRRAYLLFKRILLGTDELHEWTPKAVIDYLVLGNQAFHHVSDWQQTLKALHHREQTRLPSGFESWKAFMMKRFDAPQGHSDLSRDLQRMNALIQVFPEAGLTLMTGSDYLESLIVSYHKDHSLSQPPKIMQQILTEHLYRGLRSLMSDQTKHISVLLDHLYLLRTETGRRHQAANIQRDTIFSSLLCTTAFLRHLARDSSVAETERGRGLIDTLSAVREQTRHLHPLLPIRRYKVSKGKAKARDGDDFHVHKATQISQIQDLFPNYSNAYVLKLLDHFENNVEQAIAALLEPESLPPNLRDLDATGAAEVDLIERQRDLAPRSTPPLVPERRNIYDNDEFDRLRVSSKQIHRGRRVIAMDEPTTKDEHARSKAAIMAALATFDSDDDERDDTYDVADVGGSVDQSVDTDSRPRGERPLEQNPYEETLFTAWKANIELFQRDSKTRISPVRQDLKRQTGLSDEQIEGWAIMLGRDKTLQDRLQKKYSHSAMLSSSQRALEQTKWQQTSSQEASADEGEGLAIENITDGRRIGQGQIRGARNWGRGRGGGTSGPANDPATQAARRRKEQGRGRGGAHNRREGRAKKMGRGMGGPPV